MFWAIIFQRAETMYNVFYYIFLSKAFIPNSMLNLRLFFLIMMISVKKLHLITYFLLWVH